MFDDYNDVHTNRTSTSSSYNFNMKHSNTSQSCGQRSTPTTRTQSMPMDHSSSYHFNLWSCLAYSTYSYTIVSFPLPECTTRSEMAAIPTSSGSFTTSTTFPATSTKESWPAFGLRCKRRQSPYVCRLKAAMRNRWASTTYTQIFFPSEPPDTVLFLSSLKCNGRETSHHVLFRCIISRPEPTPISNTLAFSAPGAPSSEATAVDEEKN